MADLEVVWQGVTFGGLGGDFLIEELTGWDDLPEITSYDQARSRGHGDHIGDQFARSRIVTIAGTIASRTARDELALILMGVSPVSSQVEDLTIETFGQVLTAGARLVRRSLPVGDNYASGLIPFALQWRCSDPLRYGPERSAATGLPTAGGGLEYGLAYGLDYGDPGGGGSMVLTNEGTADAPIRFEVTGPLPVGFEIAAVGERLTYVGEVPAGQVVVIDTAEGTVLVEGTADRRGNLSWADWLLVPAGTAMTVQFASLGGDYSAEARLSARVKPAYW